MQRMSMLLASLVLAVAWQVPANGALSAECRRIDTTFAAMPAPERLTSLVANNCLGDDADSEDPVTKRFARDLPDEKNAKDSKPIKAGEEEKRFVVVDELDELAKAARAEASRRASQAREQEILNKLADRIDQAKGLAAQSADPRTAGLHQPGRWNWNRQDHEFPQLDIDVKNALLAEPCKAPTSAACTSAYEAGQQVLRLAQLAKRALTYYSAPVIAEAAREATRRNTMWTSYFDDARMQYPHELWLNGVIWARQAKKQRGFREAPSYQVIWLHPNAGLEYIRNAAAGSRLQPALYLEWIGYNGWSYDKTSHKVSGGLGASIVRVYTDAAGVQSTANGIMLHWKQRYSLAATRRDGKTGIVLSADLASLFGKTEQDWRDKVRFARALFGD